MLAKEPTLSTLRTVLITGAAGRIGSFLTRHLQGRYDFVLADVRQPEETLGYPFFTADVAELDDMRRICHGIDTVVHLAADPNTQATWESLLPRNVVGVYNIFQAAREAGCRRVIFASSVNVVSGYPAEVQVQTSMPARPPNLYGATKAWGEAVARFYADQHGLSAVCLRFGWVIKRDTTFRAASPLDLALTYEDLARLIVVSIDAPDEVRFGIFHGLSNNRWNRLDISETRSVLGYEPQDDAFVLAGILPPR